MQHPYAIGVDIGGTHISCAALHLPEARLLEPTRSRATYTHDAPAETILKNWAKALNNTLAQIEHGSLAGIGFAIPGPFDYRNGTSKMEHKFKNLLDVHIPTALTPLLQTEQDLTMRFLNDASSFAVGEAWVGEGKPFQRLVAITLGTGFGSAFTHDGVPVVRGKKVPKEGCLWHLPFKKGIADDYFSTRWFLEEYQKRGGEPLPGVKELMAKADTDAVARDLFEQFGANLAECLAGPLQTFEAEALVMGGNISHALPHFGDAFRAGLEKQGVSVQIALSKLKESAALIGSARLLDDVFWEKAPEELPRL